MKASICRQCGITDMSEAGFLCDADICDPEAGGEEKGQGQAFAEEHSLVSLS